MTGPYLTGPGEITVPLDVQWFPARVSARSSTSPRKYSAVEQWKNNDVWDDVVTGRFADKDTDPAYSVDPSIVFAVDDQVLMRRNASETHGIIWELIPVGDLSCCRVHTREPDTGILPCPPDEGSESGSGSGCRVSLCDCENAERNWQSEYIYARTCANVPLAYAVAADLVPGVDYYVINGDDGAFAALTPTAAYRLCTGNVWSIGNCAQNVPPIGAPGGIPQRACVTLSGGTGSFVAVADPVVICSALATPPGGGAGWAVSYTSPDGTFRIYGHLVACMNVDPPQLYFVGTVSSSTASGSGSGSGSGSDCGCYASIYDCPDPTDGVQEVVSALDMDAGTTSIEITTVCGSLTLSLGPCDLWFCPEVEEDPDNLCLVIPSGDDEGSYPLTYAGTPGGCYPTWTATLASARTVTLTSRGAGIGYLAVGDVLIRSDGYSCDPVGLTFTDEADPLTGFLTGGGGLSVVRCDATPGGCQTCTLAGLTPSLVIPDGVYAGTYAGTNWTTTGYAQVVFAFGEDAGSYVNSEFTVGGELLYAVCRGTVSGGTTTAYTGKVWLVSTGLGFTTALGPAHLPDTDCGPPVVMTGIPVALGATGPTTITT